MSRITQIGFVFLFAYILVTPCWANPGSDSFVSFFLTADVNAQLEICQDCSSDDSLGGLSRLGTLVDRLRQEELGMLLVDAGNGFYGADSMKSEGMVMVFMFNTLGYDAVNLSFRDFRLGKEATLTALKEAKFPIVSANLYDETTGSLIGKPYVIKKAGVQRIALIGITQSPAGLASLPHLKEQLAGIRIESPLEALEKWLPKAMEESDQVVLLYYGSPAGLEPIRERFEAELSAVLVGGSRPEYLPSSGELPVIGTTERGQHLTQVKFVQTARKIQGEVSQIPIDSTLYASDEIEKVIAQYKPEALSKSQAKEVISEKVLPETLQTLVSGSNKAVRVEIKKYKQMQEIAGQTAPSGKIFLVLDTRWENIHPKQKIEKSKLEGKRDPTMGVGGLGFGGAGKKKEPEEYVEIDVPYRIERLVDHVYALADGLAYALHSSTEKIPGGVQRFEQFTLNKQGEAHEEKLVFLVDKEAENLGFHFFDYNFGNIALPIQGDKAQAFNSKGPLKVLAYGEAGLGEFVLNKVDSRKKYAVERAPEGWHFAVVEIGGKSLSAENDMRNIIEIEPLEYIWVRTQDGHFYYCQANSTAEGGMLRFTPEYYQYQELAFLVPSNIDSFDLGIRLQNDVTWLKMIADEGMLVPEPIALHRDGDVMEILVFGMHTKEDTLLLDLGIRSLTPNSGVEIQAHPQFVLIADDRQYFVDKKASALLPNRPPKPFIVPPSTFLRFELAYNVPATPTMLRYQGYKDNADINLKGSEPIVTQTIEQSKDQALDTKIQESNGEEQYSALNPAGPGEIVIPQKSEKITGQELPFQSDFSDLSTNWEIWDDPDGSAGPSLWQRGLTEFSGISTRGGNEYATMILINDIAASKYIIETTIFNGGDHHAELVGFVYGYKDPENYSIAGYSSNYGRYELRNVVSGKSTLISSHDISRERYLPLQLKQNGKEIHFIAGNETIFKQEYESNIEGRVGLGVSRMNGNGIRMMFGPVKVFDTVNGEKDKVIFEENYSDGYRKNWEIVNNPRAIGGEESQWQVALTEYSGIWNNKDDKHLTSLIAGESSWKNYSVILNIEQVRGGDGTLSGIVFGYQDYKHFYHAGYNYKKGRYELGIRTENGFEVLSYAEEKLPRKTTLKIQLDFTENRIRLISNSRVIFDVDNKYYRSGKIGIDTSSLGDGNLFFRDIKVLQIEPDELPPRGIQDLLSYRMGAGVIYQNQEIRNVKFTHAIDHKLNKEDYGEIFHLDLSAHGLPIETVFCFPQGRFAEVHKLGIKLGPKFHPKKIKVYASRQSPKEAFELLATLSIAPEENSYQEFNIEPEAAKYLKVQIVEAHDSQSVEIKEIVAKGFFVTGGEDRLQNDLGDIQIQEMEPNNTQDDAQLLPLDTLLGGNAGADDDDFYKITKDDNSGNKLAISINNSGILRPSYTLVNDANEHIEPEDIKAQGATVEIVYDLEPGDYYLKIFRPRSYLTIVFDASGSMEDSIPTVQKVLGGYLENLGDDLSIKMMKYSHEAVHLSEFTNNRDELVKAIDRYDRVYGGTDTFIGLKAAIDSLDMKSGNRAIIAILDVVAFDDPKSQYIHVWDMLLDKGVSVSTVGVLYGWDTRTKIFGNTRRQLLKEMSYATGGHLYYSPTEEVVSDSAQIIFDQLTSPIEYRLKANVIHREKKPGFVEVILEKGKEKETTKIAGKEITKNVEIIFDASNSMWGQIAGESKIAIAKRVLRTLIEGLPETMNVGLRIYGHRHGLKSSKACKDSELAIPIQEIDKRKLIDTIEAVKPRGKTPLVYSVLQAGTDFNDIDNGSIILITDGIESCDGDIGSIAPALKKSGVELKVHIVGFAIKDQKARNELEGIAESTEGTYLDAKDSEELLSALEKTMQAEYLIVNEAGDIVAKGFVGGDPIEILEGNYKVKLLVSKDEIETAVRVIGGETTTKTLMRKDGEWQAK